MTAADERRRLLAVARIAVTRCARGEPAAPASADDAAARRAGAFVSLHRHGQLRGCVGHVEADRLLDLVVADCARMACEADPRFPRLGPAELEGLEIEISILGPLIHVSGIDSIVVGRDGLLIEQGSHQGLLLPQVASARHWTPLEFVEQTCVKAGLAPDAWRHGPDLWRFEAEVFGEEAIPANAAAP